MPSSLQLRKIEKHKIGIRSGTDVRGAAYALSDLGDELNGMGAMMNRFRFITNPARGGDWERAWAQRYFNSVQMIKLLAPHGRLLVVSGAHATAERYSPGQGALGHGKTFQKCNRLAPDSQIIAQRDYDENDSVPDLLAWVTSVIDGLDDPGNDFF